MSRVTVSRGRVLVEPEVQTVLEGGIHIPESAQSQTPSVGLVLAHGRGRQLEGGKEADIGISLQDGVTRVFYPKNSGIEIRHENKKCLVLSYDDILGAVPAPPKPISEEEKKEKASILARIAKTTGAPANA